MDMRIGDTVRILKSVTDSKHLDKYLGKTGFIVSIDEVYPDVKARNKQFDYSKVKRLTIEFHEEVIDHSAGFDKYGEPLEVVGGVSAMTLEVWNRDENLRKLIDD